MKTRIPTTSIPRRVPGLAALASLLACIPSQGMIDRDGDGMSDVWEALHGAQSLSPGADEDGDGDSNVVESVHGTDPRRADSRLGIADLRNYPSATVLRWNSVPGVSYRIERAETLDSGVWSTLGYVEGQHPTTTYLIPAGSTPEGYFRIGVESGLPSLSPPAIGAFRTLDTDKDGVPDIDEWIAGTSLIDGGSRLGIEAIETGGGVRVEWKTEKGKSYRVQARRPSEDWGDIALVAEGDGRTALAFHALPTGGDAPEYRIVADDIDTDGDGVTNWEECLTGFDPTLGNSIPGGGGDEAELLLLLDGRSVVTVEAASAVANISRLDAGAFEIHRSGGIGALDIHYTLEGTAGPDADYVRLPNETGYGRVRTGTIHLPFGSNSAVLPVIPLATSSVVLSAGLLLALSPSADHDLGAAASQRINVVREVSLSVADFGTVGDGVADDSQALQNALDALVASTSHNTLFFPDGTYRLDSPVWTPHTFNTSEHRILQMDTEGHGERDFFLVGGENATLYSTVSPLRAKMLVVLADFRTMEIRGLRWEKTSTPLSASNGHEPNGAAAVAFAQIAENEIERVRIAQCFFSNCHRAITFAIPDVTLNGRLRIAAIRDCTILNPYGSNTENGSFALGGGTQVYLTPWIRDALYEGNYFSGGPANLVNSPLSPGGIYKDGAHFGSPLKLRFIDNIVENMGVEGIFQTNENTRLGITLVPFAMPPADGSSSIEVPVSFNVGAVTEGQEVNLRSAGLSNEFKVMATDPQAGSLTLMNIAAPGSAEPGTTLNPGQVYLQVKDPTVAIITGNWFDRSNADGIVSLARSTITDNVIVNCLLGVHMHEDATTPRFNPGSDSLIASNLVITRDPRRDGRRTYGIYSWAPQTRILDNLVLTPHPSRFTGINSEGKDVLVGFNHVITSIVAHTSYTSFYRSSGTTLGNRSGQVLFQSNTTYGLDVGVGPLNAHQGIPHWVVDHRSKADVLPVDPVGLVTP